MNKFPVCPIFIPANRLEWVEKTFDKGTDAVIIDLEDSVPKEQKDETRTNLFSYLDSHDFDKTILIIALSLNVVLAIYKSTFVI